MKITPPEEEPQSGYLYPSIEKELLDEAESILKKMTAAKKEKPTERKNAETLALNARDHSDTHSAVQGDISRREGDHHSHFYSQIKEPEPKSDFLQVVLKWVAFAALLAGSFTAGMKFELVDGKPYILQRVIPLHRDFCHEISVPQGGAENIINVACLSRFRFLAQPLSTFKT